MIKKIIYSLVFVIFLFTLASCNKDKKENTNDEYLDVNSFELFEYKNEVSHEEFIKKFEEKVLESYSILENDFVMSEDIYTLDKSKKNDKDYSITEEYYLSTDGAFDKDNKTIERKIYSKRIGQYPANIENKYNDYEAVEHFQNVEGDDDNYEIDLLDKSYEKIDIKLDTTIRYLFNDTFFAKADFNEFIVVRPNNVVTYVDNDLFTLTFEYICDNTIYAIRRDIYQMRIDTNSIDLLYDLSSHIETNKKQDDYKYKAIASIDNKDVNVKPNFVGNDLSLQAESIKKIEDDYYQHLDMYLLDYNIYNVNNECIYIFEKGQLSSMRMSDFAGIHFGCGSSYCLWKYDGNEFVNCNDLYLNDNITLSLLKRLAERHYLTMIEPSGNIDEAYYITTLDYDFMLYYIPFVH